MKDFADTVRLQTFAPFVLGRSVLAPAMEDDQVRDAVRRAMAHEAELAKLKSEGSLNRVFEPCDNIQPCSSVAHRAMSPVSSSRNADRQSCRAPLNELPAEDRSTTEFVSVTPVVEKSRMDVSGTEDRTVSKCDTEHMDKKTEKLSRLTASQKKESKHKIGANWAALRGQMDQSKKPRRRPRRGGVPLHIADRAREKTTASDAGLGNSVPGQSMFVKGSIRAGTPAKLTRLVALDCEYVGVGVDGREDALARASLVNFRGEVLYDSFVRIERPVVDYRTHVSGVRPEDVNGPSAADPRAARAEIASMLKGRILVGHAVRNDLRVLRIAHPLRDIRDTATYFKQLWKMNGKRSRTPPSLKVVVARILGVDVFQKQEHDSVEDARAALALYKKSAKEWEATRQKNLNRARATVTTEQTTSLS